jgi:hypothetical protein
MLPSQNNPLGKKITIPSSTESTNYSFKKKRKAGCGLPVIPALV